METAVKVGVGVAVGAFYAAGAWMLWKIGCALDSEVKPAKEKTDPAAAQGEPEAVPAS